MLWITGAVFTLLTPVLLSVHALPAFESRFDSRQNAARVVTKCTKPNTVALTFDDGPSVHLTNLSDILTAAGAKGTFFFNGNNYGCIYAPENVQHIKYVYSKGHQVASHTWAHQNLSSLNTNQIHREFSLLDQALQRIVGVYPAFMRPPYGEYNNRVRQVAAQRGQKISLWDFDSGDSVGMTPDQSKQLYTDIAAQHPSTILALNHDVDAKTVYEVIPHAIKVLKEKGYKLVTLADCLGERPYHSIRAPQTGTWSCG